MSDLQVDLDNSYLGTICGILSIYMSLDVIIASLNAGNFDYTFTNRELEDVLGFLERRQSGIPIEEDDTTSFLLPGPTTTLSLQFQPHPHSSILEDDITLPNNAHQQWITGTVNSIDNHPIRLFIPNDDVVVPKIGVSTIASGNSGRPVHHDADGDDGDDDNHIHPSGGDCTKTHQQRHSSRQISITRTPAPTTTVHVKQQHISHSTVEKQRRDRINALIDELRDLVPPRSHDEAMALQGNAITNHVDMTLSSRRPKHAVLADTIALVKDLQHQLSIANQRSTTAMTRNASVYKDDSVVLVVTNESKNENNDKNEQRREEAAGARQALPPPPAMVPEEEGVEIDPGDGCLYVKVHCKDRHGLLSDIVRTLRSIPLEIKTAAVTTTSTGNVYDIFEVVGPSLLSSSASVSVGAKHEMKSPRLNAKKSSVVMDITSEETIEIIRGNVEAAVLNGVVAAEKRRRHEVA